MITMPNLCKTATLKKTKNWFSKVLQNAPMLLTFIILPFVIMIFVLSIFEWPFYTCFTVIEQCNMSKLLFGLFVCKGKKINELYLARGLSPLQTHKPYSRLHISACICIVCIASYDI